jgi:hypothetical protein
MLQLAVFDLDEEQLLTDAGTRGYVAALGLVMLMTAPSAVGIVLGNRARRLGERRLGGAGIVVNALVAAYLVLTAGATLLFG